MVADPATPGPAGADGPEGALRRTIVRDGVAVGVATGSYGISFGALASAADLSLWQTVALSVLMFTGASQFAFVGVVGSGGNPFAGTTTAVLLGSRNALYGLGLARVLGLRGSRRAAAAHLMIDESAAMAVAQDGAGRARLAYWTTGLSVFVGWNVATVAGAVAADALAEPETLGLDAAAPAAFLALLAPRLQDREPWAVAVAAAVVAVALTPVAAEGVPVLCAALVAVVVGLGRTAGGPDRRSDGGSPP